MKLTDHVFFRLQVSHHDPKVPGKQVRQRNRVALSAAHAESAGQQNDRIARVAALRCCRAGRSLGRQRGGVTNVHSAFLIDLGKHNCLPGYHWVSQMQMRQALCGASNVAEWHLGSGPSDAGSTTLARTRQFVTNG